MNSSAFTVNSNSPIKTLPLGAHKVVVIDDFLNAPEAMVEYATRASYSHYPGYEKRKGYPGIRALAPKDYSYNITTYLEPIIKRELEVPAQLDIRKSPCAFSLLTMKAETLGPLQSTPHFDSSTPHHIAVLLYLCSEEHGGTAFFRHNRTGLDQISADTVENYLDIYYEELNTKRPAPGYFSGSNEFFTQTGSVTAKFNRLVIYKGSLLHAPFISSSASVSSNPLTGRLTVNTFYDF